MADEAHEQIQVDADVASCFALATDFEGYPAWAKDVKVVHVVDRDDLGRATRVEYRVSALGRTIRYTLEYDFAEAPDAFSWSLAEGDMLRSLDGRYSFTSDGGGTRVGYDLRVDMAVPMPGIVKRRAAGLIVGNALRDFKLAVEEGGVVEQLGAERSDTAEHHGEAHPDAIDFEVAGGEPRSLPAPSVLESVIGELLGAVPEVRDHVLEAADALLDAAKALLDAADRVVRQQRGEC